MGVLARAPRYVSAAAYNPLTLTPTHWFRANDLVGADASAVATWTDLSGNAYNATQATGANQPTLRTSVLGGKSVVRFDGANDFVRTASNGTFSQPSTFVVVAKLNGTGTQKFIIDGMNANRHALFREATDRWYAFAGTVYDFAASDNAWNIFVITFNGASSKVWLNGGASFNGSTGAQTYAGVTIGAQSSDNSPMDGDVAEVLAANSALSLTQINDYGNSLATFYGLTWSTAT